jgi:hypothetical protein
VLRVPDVQLDSLLPRDPRAAADLGPAGHPGLELEAAALPLGVQGDLGREGRPRPDDRHLAAQDVHQVRKLVQRESTQEAAGRRHARVALDDSGSDSDRIGSRAHRSQLPHVELLAADPDPPLPVDDRPARAQLDRQRRQRQQRGEQDQRDDRDRDVDGSRQPPARLAHRVPSTFSQPIGTAPARMRSQSPTAMDAVTVR